MPTKLKTAGAILKLGALLAASCSLDRAYLDPDLEEPHAPRGKLAEIDATLLLIGDAGKASPSDPVLLALRTEASECPKPTLILFLGDNVYDHGVPREGASGREEALERLRFQVDTVLGANGARAIFLPGNHDHYSGGGGLEREKELVERWGDSRISWAPPPGSMGPERRSFAQSLELALLDTELLVRRIDDFQEGRMEIGSCGEIEEAFGLEPSGDPDRHLVVAGHHPLRTHGPHGGFFSWKAQLFPLTERWDYLFIPIPLFYPILRRAGLLTEKLAREDVFHPAQRTFQHELEETLEESGALIYAAGHEHALQLLREEDGPYLIVSGAGSIDRPGDITKGEDTLFASPEAGFFRLDFLDDGCVRLMAIEVLEDRTIRTPLSIWLESSIAPHRSHSEAENKTRPSG